MPELTQARLRELLDYDPATGVFRWRESRGGVKAGKEAGAATRPDRYRLIMIDYRNYHAGRLAFLWMTGAWPDSCVDHINRNPADNRWCNLRPASVQENNCNSKVQSNNRLGVAGVYYRKNLSNNPYEVRISKDGKYIWIGQFPTLEEAVAARQKAEREVFGEFAPNHY